MRTMDWTVLLMEIKSKFYTSIHSYVYFFLPYPLNLNLILSEDSRLETCSHNSKVTFDVEISLHPLVWPTSWAAGGAWWRGSSWSWSPASPATRTRLIILMTQPPLIIFLMTPSCTWTQIEMSSHQAESVAGTLNPCRWKLPCVSVVPVPVY